MRQKFILIFIFISVFFTFIQNANCGVLSGNSHYNFIYDAEGNIENLLTMDINYYNDFNDFLYSEAGLTLNFSNKEYNFFLIPKEIYLGTFILAYNLDIKAGLINSLLNSNKYNGYIDNTNIYSSNYYNGINSICLPGIELNYYLNENIYLKSNMLFPSIALFNYLPLWENYYKKFIKNYLNKDTFNCKEYIPKGNNFGIELGYIEDLNYIKLRYYNGYYEHPFPTSVSYAGNNLEVILEYLKKNILELEIGHKFYENSPFLTKINLSYIIPEEWKFQEDYFLKDPYMQIIFGLDWLLSPSFFTTFNYIFNFQEREWNGFSSIISFEIEAIRKRYKPFYTLVYNIGSKELLNTFGVNYKIDDNLGVEVKYSSDETLSAQINWSF